jgi:hypothetical protein
MLFNALGNAVRRVAANNRYIKLAYDQNGFQVFFLVIHNGASDRCSGLLAADKSDKFHL